MYRRDHQRIGRAPAKLNLYLEVLGQREDGFHEVETLMVPIRLSDSVIFTSTPAASNGSPGAILLNLRMCWPARSPYQPQNVPGGATNLVVRALERLRDRSGCRR